MRLWALFPFLVIALALASPPAFAQAPATPPGQERAEEAKKNNEAKKAAQEAKKEAKNDETADPGDDPGAGGDADDGSGGGGGEGGSDGSEDGEGGGPDDQGETGGEPGGGASGGSGGSGGQSPRSGERPTPSSGSADEGGPGRSVDGVACVEECASARDRATSAEGDVILTATRVLSVPAEGVTQTPTEALGRLPNRWGAFGPSTAGNGNPAVFALLAVSTLFLLVGVAGGLKALRGLRES